MSKLKNMKSTIRVDLDFDKNEPFIQITLASTETHHMIDVDTKLDLADKALKSFVEQANIRGIEIIYPEGRNNNSSPQIRVKGYDKLWENSEELKQFLEDYKAEFEVVDQSFVLKGKYDLFIMGKDYGRWQLEKSIDKKSE